MYNDRENIETDTETKTPSDTKILLAPLGRYALIGLAITATIVTTAIMLDDQLNDIDREVAHLKAELRNAERRQDAREEAADVVKNVGETNVQAEEVILAQSPPVVNIAQPASASGETASKTLPVTDQSMKAGETGTTTQPPAPARARAAPATAPVYYTEPRPVFERPAFMIDDWRLEDRNARNEDFIQERRAEHEQWLAESRAFMEAMDREYLENIREYQARSLETMREQIAREQQRLEEKEQRFLELYRKRAEDLQRRQEERYRMFSDRI